jgi:hypothetical protein
MPLKIANKSINKQFQDFMQVASDLNGLFLMIRTHCLGLDEIRNVAISLDHYVGEIVSLASP